MVAFTIGGDFNWVGNSTFNTTMSVLGNQIGTIGNNTWGLIANNISYITLSPATQTLGLNNLVAGFNTSLNGDQIFISALSAISANSSSYAFKVANVNIVTINSSRDIVMTPDDFTLTATGTVTINPGSGGLSLQAPSGSINISASTILMDGINQFDIISSASGIYLTAFGDVNINCENTVMNVNSLLQWSVGTQAQFVAGTSIIFQANTSVSFAGASYFMYTMPSTAPVVAAPAISLPVGYKYLIIKDSDSSVSKMG